MRLLPLIVFAASLPAFAATAPDSIAGKVFRGSSYIFSTRYETTIVFLTNGRFIFLKSAWGQRPISPTTLAKVVVRSPASDGTFTYVRTNETDASVQLLGDDGKPDGFSLRFTSATGGNVASGSVYSFSLTDLAGAQTVPASNVSMRGRVSPGHPLIVGFIVPGSPAPPRVDVVPAPGARFQEIVIRVVGPSLSGFGIADGWADPDFQLYQGASLADVDEAHGGDWQATTPYGAPGAGGLEKIFNYVGAFPLVAGSKDAADVVRLAPGAYTVVCNPASGDPGGEALIEVYFLP